MSFSLDGSQKYNGTEFKNNDTCHDIGTQFVDQASILHQKKQFGKVDQLVRVPDSEIEHQSGFSEYNLHSRTK